LVIDTAEHLLNTGGAGRYRPVHFIVKLPSPRSHRWTSQELEHPRWVVIPSISRSRREQVCSDSSKYRLRRDGQNFSTVVKSAGPPIPRSGAGVLSTVVWRPV